MTEDEDIDDDGPFDLKTAEADARAGAKLMRELIEHVGDDWNRWTGVIAGLRGLRGIAMHKTGTRDVKADAYRKEMSRLLSRHEFTVYEQMGKQNRSAAYRIMDHLDEVNDWYIGLDQDDRMSWKSPQTIVKHCPASLLSGPGHNKPKPKRGKPKPLINAETERLKALLLQVIKRLAKHEPEALQLLDQLYVEDPDDDLPGDEEALR